MKKALFIVALFSVRLQAHDVIWTENPFGIPGDLPFATPLSIYYKVGDARAAVFPPSRQFRVAPTRGEPCVVEVQLDKPESQFLAFENPTPAPDREVTVIVRLTPIPLSTNKIEAEVTGRWRAVLGQDPKVC